MWALALACSSPSARLDTVEITGLGWDAADARLRLIVDDPWPVDLPVTAVRWAMTVDGRPLASGSTEEELVLAARASTPVVVPFRVRYDALPTAVAGGVPYHADVELDLATPLGRRTLPLATDGVLPELTAPSASLVSWSFTRDGFAGRLALDLAVGLPSWVAGGSLAWRVTADQQLLGSGSAALTERRLALVVYLDAGAMASAGWDAAWGTLERVTVDLDGALDTAWGSVPLGLHREIVLAP